MTASCAVPTVEFTSPADRLDQALSDNTPERLDTTVLERLAPHLWLRERAFSLDLEAFAQGVVQHLCRALAPAPATPRASSPSPRAPVVHALPRRRRGGTAFEQPHRLARVLYHAQRHPGWAVVVPIAARVPVPAHRPWSWSWVWALPEDLLLQLESDPTCQWWSPGMASRPDTDGFSAWEALVQPHTWRSLLADRLYERFGLDHPAFAGQMVAAWRANNPAAQRWWLDHAGEEQVVDQINAWHALRTPAQQGHAPVIALERQRLDEALGPAPVNERVRRRL